MWRSRVIGPLIPVKSRITRPRPFLCPSVSLASTFSLFSSHSFFTLALFLSHSCLPVEPNPAPRSRVQRRSLQRSVINHRRVGLTRLHAREPARARRELLSSSFFFFSSFYISLHEGEKEADGAKKRRKIARKAAIVVLKFFSLIISVVLYSLCVFYCHLLLSLRFISVLISTKNYYYYTYTINYLLSETCKKLITSH